MIFVALFCSAGQAATAVVECIADSAVGPANMGTARQLPLTGVMMRFRFEAIRNWKIGRAELHVHLAQGTQPPNLEIAVSQVPFRENEPVKLDLKKLQFLRHKTEGREEGWMSLGIEPSLVEMLASGKAITLVIRDRASAAATRFIDSRENNFTAAYLLVDGEKPR